MHKLQILPECEKEIKKLIKNNDALRKSLKKKLRQILKDPERFKPLKRPMAGFSRVHIGGVFVLIFKSTKKSVILIRFRHHDEVYK